ncbi:MAG TPA: L,D-transpeptidase family protein [Flavipsychrobacter sp.]|nr:L,D-transpeptidase family protein [Flavipsychrobacter sp.]
MKKYFILSATSVVLCLLFSCNEDTSPSSSVSSVFSDNKFDAKSFSTRLKPALQPVGTDSGRSKNSMIRDRIYSLYNTHEFAPIWLSANGKTAYAEKLIKDLENVSTDGIDPERYHLASLKKQLDAYKTSEVVEVGDVISLDTGLTGNYLRASRELLMGMIAPRSVDSLWFHANDTVWNTTSLLTVLKAGEYPSLDSYRSKLHEYALMRTSLAHYKTLSQNDSLITLRKALSADPSSDSNAASVIALEAPWLNSISDTLYGAASKIQAYQQYFGLKRTGKLDSTTLGKLRKSPSDMVKLISANLERMRWLPQSLGEEYVIVNIPTMEMKLVRGNNTAIKMNVVVGKPSRQTPVLNAEMANVVFNPPWGVPPTILKKDVVPGVMRSGGAYLRKKGLEAFDAKGKRVDASAVTGGNYRRYFFRQPPGHSNALGYVKFNFPNKWDIYMHDTPHREDFEKFDRARSSGCIRLHHPQELAKYILNEIEGRDYQQEKIDSLISTHKTKFETLKNKIPVHILYLTAYDDGTGNHIRFARDFYNRDAKLMAALSK